MEKDGETAAALCVRINHHFSNLADTDVERAASCAPPLLGTPPKCRSWLRPSPAADCRRPSKGLCVLRLLCSVLCSYHFFAASGSTASPHRSIRTLRTSEKKRKNSSEGVWFSPHVRPEGSPAASSPHTARQQRSATVYSPGRPVAYLSTSHPFGLPPRGVLYSSVGKE